MFARIWVSVPDVIDGYFVEILDEMKTCVIQIDCAWFPTIEICEKWARNKGVERVEMFLSDAS